MEQITLYNTLAGKKELFKPLEGNQVFFYCCGPTVYNYIHIGNARAFVLFDFIRRYMAQNGYTVTFIQNITDVEDKIIKKAAEEKMSWDSVAERFTRAFQEDMARLGVLSPDISPKATETLPAMITLIETLEKKGFTYTISDGVYFRVRKFEGYGKLSKKSLDDLRAGSRISVNDEKEDPFDFALWKFSKPGEPAWESPWGKGRPGWHIECSAMSRQYAGRTLDIHAGGEDLVFPHHENEIAQSEAALGEPLARYWMHNAYVNLNGAKMSKSLGNDVTVRSLLKDHPPQVLRLFLFSAHYRKLLDFTADALADAEAKYQRFNNFFHTFSDVEEKEDFSLVKEWDERVRAFLNDDFNTSGALGVFFEAVAACFKEKDPAGLAGAVKHWLRRWDSLFFILPGEETSLTGETLHGLMEILIDIRHRARASKDFELADMIRDRLKELGIMLEDTPEGTRYKKR
ncbi:MAG TPA: cysteine--tRNA ligase [Candidatus Mcinerneyibacteriales bacterium]|nr:cysteine--tRNA ligase [Candidatus Mcinerneyibacteriales bacterium]